MALSGEFVADEAMTVVSASSLLSTFVDDWQLVGTETERLEVGWFLSIFPIKQPLTL